VLTMPLVNDDWVFSWFLWTWG